MDYIKIVSESYALARDFFSRKHEVFEKAASVIVQSLRVQGKILIFGNGGSAAQAQHFAAELVNKFIKARRALPALALSTDGSAITAIANDSAFDRIFARQLEALGKAGDVALGISTSGRSPSVIRALEQAKAGGILTVALTGSETGPVSPYTDIILDVPSLDTPRIQECHLIILHLMAQLIEEKFT